MIIEQYTEWLENNRNYATNTIRNYKRTMELFSSYLKEHRKSVEDTKSIKLGVIENFIAKQRTDKDVRTCNNYLACIKLFLRFCLIKWYKTEDYKKLMFAREVRKKIEALEDADVNKMFNYLKDLETETNRQEVIRLRNLVILQLLVYTGVRVGELVNIKIDDIGEQMQIIGKWGKRRVVNLYEDDLGIIRCYLFARRKYDSDYLLISFAGKKKGERISKVAIEQVIRDIGKNAGIQQKVYPHKLRHTFATKLLRCNANIFHIQQLLWHSNITTTQTYLTALNSELRQTQKLLHQK